MADVSSVRTASLPRADSIADAGRLNRLVGQSQSAAGNLEVSQAGNQIEALAAQQLIQIEGLLASHYRAEALKRSADLAEEARGDDAAERDEQDRTKN